MEFSGVKEIVKRSIGLEPFCCRLPSNGRVRAHILRPNKEIYLLLSGGIFSKHCDRPTERNCVHTTKVNFSVIMGLFDYSNFYDNCLKSQTHNFRE